MLGGAVGELNLGALLVKRGTVHAAALRSRPLEQKAAIVAGTEAHVWPLISSGQVKPVVHRVLPLAEAAEAHRIVEASEHIGKVVLTVR
jgi:NADPH:quinone reductase-like Zn-dependent oxidoreductase